MRRPVCFYSVWPLGYHNPGAERRAGALAAAGYDVTYVAGVGIRNPRFSSVPKLVDRSARKLRSWRPRAGPSTRAARSEAARTVREGAVIVLPPRQYAAMRDINSAWLARQLRSQIGPWNETLAWIRYPTPELVDALPRLGPARIVYEAFDAYEATPGIVGRWKPILARADRLLAEQADLVVVVGDKLAERYQGWGAAVRVVPHGVDLAEWRGRPARQSEPVVVGFVGTIDYRLSVPVLRAIALSHPEWKVRLIGPVHDGFDVRTVSDLPNLTVERPVPSSAVPELVAGFDLGVMPYLDNQNTAHMNPVKNLEYLAAGVPAVARRLPALEPYADLLYFADTPEEFVRQLERALAEQTPERAEARRQAAEPHAWPRRLAELVAIADELTGGPEVPEPDGSRITAELQSSDT